MHLRSTEANQRLLVGLSDVGDLRIDNLADSAHYPYPAAGQPELVLLLEAEFQANDQNCVRPSHETGTPLFPHIVFAKANQEESYTLKGWDTDSISSWEEL